MSDWNSRTDNWDDDPEPKVNPAGGSGNKQDRGSWCTPRWLAEALGGFSLDPCSNPRSWITAVHTCSLEQGGDGLLEGPAGAYRNDAGRERWAPKGCETFINPPYGPGQVIRWVRHWAHTRFTFLLRWDPSTAWFEELIPLCTHVWFPKQRMNFEPPPGVKASSNPYPHALFMRDPPADRLERLSALGYLIPVDITPG